MTERAESTTPNRLRAAIEFVVVAICTLAFAASALGILAAMIGPNSAGTHDFVEYWASGQLLAQHANPYDAEALRQLERSAGFPPGAPTLFMGNPPTALLLVLPLGFVGPGAGEWLWLLAQLISFIASVQMVRASLCPKSQVHLVAYAFAPVMSCLLTGQIAVFLLLGLALFLRWRERRPLLAGASLWLCLLKPHLFVPFGVVLLIWVVLTRSYKILAGTAVAVIMSSAVATAMNPHVWSQYRQMMAEQRIDRLELPCPSIWLRQTLYPHTIWVQCLPIVCGCLWTAAYYWKRRSGWDWMRHGAVLILVSVLVAPYSWFMDQTVLLPALLYGAFATQSRALIAILALISAGIEIAALRGMGLASPLFLWTAPVWMLWFLIAIWSTEGSAVSR